MDNIGGERCEREIEAVQEQENVNWCVTCDNVNLRLTYTSSLVGQPRGGYAAYAELVSPHRTFWYSLWIYDEPAEATAARLRWLKHIRAHAQGSYYVTEEPGAVVVRAEDAVFGLPCWRRVVQKGNRLAIIKVEALPPTLTLEETLEDVKQWRGKEPADLNLQPEDEEATKAFFEDVSRSIGQSFLEAE